MKSLSEKINAELDLRLEEMEREGYSRVPRLTKWDWILLGGMSLLCFCGMLYTIFYCSAL